MARLCAVSSVSAEGGDAGERWREGRPVRVLRSSTMRKHAPEYAPDHGLRYDGIYKVVKYYPETGLSGFRVWKYLLRRDDPSPAPWEPNVEQIVGCFIKEHGTYFNTYQDKNISVIKNRDPSRLILPTHKTALCQRNSSTMSVKIYNRIPKDIRELPFSKFKTKLRRWLLEKCFYDIKEYFNTCNNL